MKQTTTCSIIVSMILFGFAAGAQTQERRGTASETANDTVSTQKPEGGSVNIGLVYPISSNGRRAKEYSNVLSLNGLAGISRSETGLSMAGLGNIILDNARGLQMAGLFNRIGNHAQGVQLAGLFNTTRRSSSGLQMAGLMNKSGDAHVQVAGLINIAKKVKGVQLAGLINIADSSEYPIGIVNIIRNGEKSIGVSVDETRTIFLSFRSGSRKLYGILGLGYNDQMHTIGNGQTPGTLLRQAAAEAGIGAHLNLTENFRVNTEIVSIITTDFDHGDYERDVLRILPSLHFQRFELFAGPTFNYVASDRGIGGDLISHYTWSKNAGAQHFQGLYFGAMAGFAYRF